MADSRSHGDADLLVVSARLDLRWLEWLVLCVSEDCRGDDAFASPARAKIANLRPEVRLRLRARSRAQRGKKEQLTMKQKAKTL